MSSARTYLEKLLAKGKLEATLEAGMLLCRHYQDTEGNAIVVQHSGQFHNLMDDYHAGTLSADDFRPERARISRAMLEWVHSIPNNWTTEPLQAAGFSEKIFDKGSAESTAQKWKTPAILVLGLAVLLAIWLWTGRNRKDADESSPSETSKPAIPPADTPAEKSSAKNQPATNTSLPKSKSLPPTQPQTSPKTGPSPKETLPETKTSGTTDQKFRSFAKLAIHDDMELGYMGDKYAFRNVRTREILCCYADAKGFSGGMAYVSLDGRNFFYINKKGEKVK